MNTTMLKSMRSEKGFTLVELAVVMVIIGLLIGGILKGQEMIANAQVTSTVAQAKAIDAATSTFRDQYDSMPGDMVGANNRLVDCALDPCYTALGTLGNGRIDIVVGGANAVTSEGAYFFNQLRAASLLSGFTGAANASFGAAFPSASVGGGYIIGGTQAGAATGFRGTELRVGHYLVLNGSTGAAANDSGALTPSQGARIDRKMDDGDPSTGGVVGDSTADNCRLAGTEAVYQESSTAATCALAIRVQG